MTKIELVKIATAVKVAVEIVKAKAHIENWDDDGTCNIDAPYLVVRGMTDAQAKEFTLISGVHCHLRRLYGKRILMLGGPEGQANRRCRMAEAITDDLLKVGLEASVYCQMD